MNISDLDALKRNPKLSSLKRLSRKQINTEEKKRVARSRYMEKNQNV